MSLSRRTFMINGLRLISVGLALPTRLFDTNSAFAADAPANSQLLNKEAILSGSSFYGSVNHSKVTIDTVNYYPQVADGDSSTGWTPMETKGPHWLEMRWRYPVKINGFSWSGDNLNAANLQYEKNGGYIKIVDLPGANGNIYFPEITTDKLRFCIIGFAGKPVINELTVNGPQQPEVPVVFPKSTFAGGKITVAQVQPLEKQVFKPGDIIHLSFGLSSASVLTTECFFIVEMREKSPNDYFREQFGDYEIAGTVITPAVPSSQWQPGQIQKMTAAIELPVYAPSGETAISIMAITNDGQQFVEVENPQFGNNKLTPITIRREEKQIKTEEFPLTQLSDKNGQRGFHRGTSFMMPFLNRYFSTSDFERLHDSRANGIDIQSFFMYASCIRPRKEWQDFIERLGQQITNTLRVRPESYFMIGMDLRVSKDWLRENPHERMLNRNGKVIIEKISPEGLVSYGSEKYLQECYNFIDQVIDFLNSKSFGGRIIGYYPYACSQNDAFIGGVQNNSMVKDRDKILIGDFHPGAIVLFREWLKQKYFSVDQLREAWHDKNVTFENAVPDAVNLAGEDVPSGIFRDPVKSRAAIDYITFFPSLIGGFYQKLAAHYKKCTDHKALVFMNYGAILQNLSANQPSGSRSHANNFDFYNLLEDDNIDMYVQSMPYNLRNADDPIVVYQPIESLNVNKRMYLADYDARTISCGTLRYGRHRSQYESKAIIQRDLAWLMIKNSGAWLSDMSKAGWREWIEYRKSWFSTPETTAPTREILELFATSTAISKKSVSEIAVILDIETPSYEDTLNAAVIYRGLSTGIMCEELPKFGAPYDVLLKSDLIKGKMRDDYKLYIFLNPFYVTQAERNVIEKLKSNGKTLLWFYAPGYASSSGLDVEGVSGLTGMRIRIKPDRKELLQMTVNSSKHPLSAGLENVTFKAETWPGAKDIHPEKIQPVFYTDDLHTINLAQYADGKTAWAARDFGAWKSIYSAVPYLDVQALRNIAQYAGVHLYCDEDIVMAVDNRFLMLTNGYEKERTLKVQLPEIKTVKDAFTGEVISRGQKYFSLEMETPQTRILTLG